MSKGAKKRSSDLRKEQKKKRKLANYLKFGPKAQRESSKKTYVVSGGSGEAVPAKTPTSKRGKAKARARKGMLWR